MKKILVALFLISMAVQTQAKIVRFAVNVSNTVVAMNDMYMTSTFIDDIGLGVDLSHGVLHMTIDPVDTNIYYYTADIPSHTLFEYYFEKGAAGYESEAIPLESQNLASGYRWIYVDSVSNDTLKLPAVYWSGNNSATDTLYRFKVSLKSEVISPNGVHIAGDFQGDNPATDIMYSFNNDQVYEYITWLTPGAMVHYKYYNGNTASTTEAVPTACAMGGKRMITSVTTATVLDTVCFNSCTKTCQAAATNTLSWKEGLSLAPNPMSYTATLMFHDAGMHDVSMMDIYGRVIKHYHDLKASFLEINKEELPAGMYQLRITNDKKDMTSLKLIIE